ncbi:hypothetical protein HHK36_013876 [Tetracentron sinense]|uniref:Uncharacterized protein n=1 Tax=Tetracentron sinense TaxID=13715 RepID=A0A835DH63_TETSI|nr:hypothetical protein HHK36_013876 [Tetracentron sinense]
MATSKGGPEIKAKLISQVLLCSIIVAFGGLMFGYDNCIPGGVTSMDDFLKKFFPEIYLKKHLAFENNYCKYDNQSLQLFTSSLYLAANLASFCTSIMMRFKSDASLLSAVVTGFVNVLATLVSIAIVKLLTSDYCGAFEFYKFHLKKLDQISGGIGVPIRCGIRMVVGSLGLVDSKEIYPLEIQTAGFFLAIVTMSTFAKFLMPETRKIPIDEMNERVWKKRWFWKSVVADTCVAMDQWVQHPTAHSALDDILPCVDNATSQESLLRSQEVTFQLVNMVNSVITNVSNINSSPNFTNINSSPNFTLSYYNQSGPLMPLLCNPFNSNMTSRTCSAGEVVFKNATQVSAAGICTTVGRVTPTIYDEMTAAVNVSYGLYHYSPFLVELENCIFVRRTFSHIEREYCPGLQQYSRWIYIGLVMVSAAVMLSLIFWIFYARERRHRAYTKEFIARSSQGPVGEELEYRKFSSSF